LPESSEPLNVPAAGATRRFRRQAHDEAEILPRFTSCGRCGLFLTVYRLSHDDEFLAALDEIEGGWLTLPWHPEMRNLVLKCYGAPVDMESYFFEGTCRECRRPFSYAQLDPDQPALFLIKL